MAGLDEILGVRGFSTTFASDELVGAAKILLVVLLAVLGFGDALDVATVFLTAFVIALSGTVLCGLLRTLLVFLAGTLAVALVEFGIEYP
jgi:hypothetical protein